MGILVNHLPAKAAQLRIGFMLNAIQERIEQGFFLVRDQVQKLRADHQSVADVPGHEFTGSGA